jgi:hypothetical protein
MSTGWDGQPSHPVLWSRLAARRGAPGYRPCWRLRLPFRPSPPRGRGRRHCRPRPFLHRSGSGRRVVPVTTVDTGVTAVGVSRQVVVPSAQPQLQSACWIWPVRQMLEHTQLQFQGSCNMPRGHPAKQCTWGLGTQLQLSSKLSPAGQLPRQTHWQVSSSSSPLLEQATHLLSQRRVPAGQVQGLPCAQLASTVPIATRPSNPASAAPASALNAPRRVPLRPNDRAMPSSSVPSIS